MKPMDDTERAVLERVFDLYGWEPHERDARAEEVVRKSSAFAFMLLDARLRELGRHIAAPFEAAARRVGLGRRDANVQNGGPPALT